MTGKFLFFTLLSVCLCSAAFAQNAQRHNEPHLFAIVKDSENAILQGYIKAQPHEVIVSTQDNQERKFLSKYLKSITLEKINEVGPANPDLKQEPKYAVRFENSQEIFTLRKKYTFSLNTNLGVVTRSIDPDMIGHIVSNDRSGLPKQQSVEDNPFIQDKSILFSLEFKF